MGGEEGGWCAVVDEVSKILECESVCGYIFPEEKADADSVK